MGRSRWRNDVRGESDIMNTLCPLVPQCRSPAPAGQELPEGKTESARTEYTTLLDTSAMPRRTPLYRKPSWLGDDEVDEQRAFKSSGKPEEKNRETGTSGCSIDAKQVEEQSAAANEEVLFPFCREPSYFEIPTKEFQQPSQITESTTHESSTKDTPSSHTTGAGYASFTIEFDDSTPGKVTIKGYVTKFTSDRRHKSKKCSPGTQDLPGIQTGMMAPENKVADSLAQNNPPQMVWERSEEDSKSIKSDVPVYLKRLKGNKHDDGTQSDSENAGAHRRSSKRATLEEHLRRHHSEQKKLQKTQATEKHQDQAVTSSAHHRGGHGVPHGKLLKQKSEEPSVSIPFLQTALLRSSGSLGHRPSQEMDKMLKNQATSAASEKDNDDDQSDTGTYTIELESPNSEEVEARKMIDKVFGVDDNQDYNRPVIKEKHKDLVKDWALNSAAVVMEERKPLSTPGFHSSEEGTSSSGNKRWVSQWASLAANHTRHDQEERIMELSVPVALENDTDISESGLSVRSTRSATSLASQGERKRLTLPQLPNAEKSLKSSRTKVIAQRSEIGDKQDTELQEKEAPTQVYQKDKQDAERALSKMNRAVNGETLKSGGDNKTLLHLGSSYSGKEKSETDKEASFVKLRLPKIQQQKQKEQAQWTPTKISSSKNISGQIDRCREEPFKQESQPQEKLPGLSISKGERVIQNESKRRKAEEILKSQTSKGGDKKESSKSLVRQGSFTLEKPSLNIPIELIPHINKQASSTSSLALTTASRIRERSDSMDTDSSLDTTLILKDTEAVMACLEAKLREDNKTDEGPDTPSYNRDNSISPECDVDTASTIGLVTGETERKSTQKRKSFTSLYKDRCSTGSPSKDVTKSSSSGAREKIEKKTKSHSTDVGSRAEGRKFVQSSGRIRQPSVDLTDDDQTSSVPHSAISDVMSSDQKTYSCKSDGRTPLTLVDEHAHSKLEGSKVTKSKTSPGAPGSSSKSTTLPRPRPTRTSLLPRARLGEASHSELADADKASVASEVSTTSSTLKPPTGRRNISRIDLLAQPRRTRFGSLSTLIDSEATTSRSSASSRTAEAIIRSGARLVPSDKFSPRIRANSISRLSDSKVKSMTSTHGSPSGTSAMPRLPPLYWKPSWLGDDEVDEQRAFKSSGKPEEKNRETGTSGTSAMPRLPPLYRKPSWLGDDEVDEQRAFKSSGKPEEKNRETGTSGTSAMPRLPPLYRKPSWLGDDEVDEQRAFKSSGKPEEKNRETGTSGTSAMPRLPPLYRKPSWLGDDEVDEQRAFKSSGKPEEKNRETGTSGTSAMPRLPPLYRKPSWLGDDEVDEQRAFKSSGKPEEKNRETGTSGTSAMPRLPPLYRKPSWLGDDEVDEQRAFKSSGKPEEKNRETGTSGTSAMPRLPPLYRKPSWLGDDEVDEQRAFKSSGKPEEKNRETGTSGTSAMPRLPPLYRKPSWLGDDEVDEQRAFKSSGKPEEKNRETGTSGTSAMPRLPPLYRKPSWLGDDEVDEQRAFKSSGKPEEKNRETGTSGTSAMPRLPPLYRKPSWLGDDEVDEQRAFKSSGKPEEKNRETGTSGTSAMPRLPPLYRKPSWLGDDEVDEQRAFKSSGKPEEKNRETGTSGTSAMPRLPPLYRKPSWLGDDEVDEQRAFKSSGKPEEKNRETGTSGKKSSDYDIK
ncbi:centrosomal protein of 170 kDa-like [Mesoplodon densirostris]|uniref:centrosomal protein of 170 kDa-like n=1 Tax=Mesoplodon densirostris TaxID=48708 RepID=UPI0028DCFE0B|nr:centrosomal protein of 170 kDa-like [Mesoplodon densirostris]